MRKGENVVMVNYIATTTGGATMTDAISSLMDVASNILTTVTGNPTLMVFFCAGLVFTAIGVVKKLK